MNEDQQRQFRTMLIAGGACVAGLVLAFVIFASLDLAGSFITRAISLPLLLGAAGCFGSAFRIRKAAKATHHR
ncbi:MAG TPA: hypothetical protein VE172_19750 [Stackebrandtia sp.]|uniref:hypothetical protein n=1 Tax=Stackebrandtia sp. TaxID=2023065 RepID=UPI002D27D3B1|nr:hypothetical protein [Stackebrandtia sp.]HZE41040.1 hypothetical protein [Stackebrandtia sp.]